MKDEHTTIQEIRKRLATFRDDRDWKQFHKPKDLALHLSIEVSEILEHFRYKTDEEITSYLKDAKNKKEFSHELADSLNLMIMLAMATDVDLSVAIKEKLDILEKRYPPELVKGKKDKQ